MSKNKLKKFAEIRAMDNVVEFPLDRILVGESHHLKGKWRAVFFGNNNPIVLELGCGRGEYTVELARRFADKNFIGIDIKGARIWSGAKGANERELSNVAFVRTDIQNISSFFANGEISEIWITFPDPQMKKVRKRLTSPKFLNLYRQVLADRGIVHLKTDSLFLFTYTSELVKSNQLPVLTSITDIYAANGDSHTELLTTIRTYYESQWLQRGISIKYLKFSLPHSIPIIDIDEKNIPLDEYRSYGRQRRTELGI